MHCTQGSNFQDEHGSWHLWPQGLLAACIYGHCSEGQEQATCCSAFKAEKPIIQQRVLSTANITIQ